MKRKYIDKVAGHGRGIYLLPNLLTTGNLFTGFYSILCAIASQFQTAVALIFIAAVLDALDGRVARLINAQSDFGTEYDSFADVVSFGVAPAILAYSWSLSELGTIGNTVVFAYMAATALRLARFNAQAGSADRRYFQGLPSPAAACLVAAFIWLQHSTLSMQHGGEPLAITCNTFALVAIAVLMVSNARYYSFKDINFRDRVPFLRLLLVVSLFIMLALWPPITLFILFVAYAAIGIANSIYNLWQRRRKQGQDNATG